MREWHIGRADLSLEIVGSKECDLHRLCRKSLSHFQQMKSITRICDVRYCPNGSAAAPERAISRAGGSPATVREQQPSCSTPDVNKKDTKKASVSLL